MIIGPCRVQQVLGRGAMGTVYRAVDDRDGGTVALKVIRKDLLDSAERDDVLIRFHREADIARKLVHPNIVRVYDVGETDEVAYLTMELVTGTELKVMADPPGGTPLDRVVGAFLQLLDALGFAHAAGVVHRDVKPANALVTEDGLVKLTDFGIARLESSEMTSLGAVMGTPPYMSPEQLLGQRVDGRADLYSAGATLFFLLTGRKPFAGSLAELMEGILNSPPPLASQLSAAAPASFDAVLVKALAKKPEDRYANAADFAQAVRAALAAAQPVAGTVAATAAGGANDDTTYVSGLAEGPAVALERLCQRLDTLLARAVQHDVTSRLAELRSSLDGALTLAGQVAPDDLVGLRHVSEFEAMLGRALAALRKLILDNAPQFGRATQHLRRDWMDAIHLFAELRDGLARRHAEHLANREIDRVLAELFGMAAAYVEAVKTEIASPDYVDVVAVVQFLQRLDLFDWALELLGASVAVSLLRTGNRTFAEQVLRKISASIKAFVDTADELARFDMASALLAMDPLIALVERIVQDDLDVALADGTRDMGLGRDCIGGFIANSRRLVALTVAELRPEVGGGDTVAFAAKLRQLGRLYTFSMRVDEASCRDELKGLGEDVRNALGELANLCLARLGQALPAERLPLHQQLTAIHDVAARLGWAQFAQSVVMRLRNSAAYDAVGRDETSHGGGTQRI